jgi:hypothetical protein
MAGCRPWVSFFEMVMEIKSSETENRIAGNIQVLAQVEAEITLLEEKFAGLESLESEKDRLATVVRNLVSEETATLAETTLTESLIVKRLGEIRGRRDVQSSRLNSVQDRITNAQADLVEQAANVRKGFSGIISKLLQSRQTRALAALTELIGSPFVRLRIGRAELGELVHQTVMVKEVKTVWNTVSQSIGDPLQELQVLRLRTREWLAQARNLVENEPGLMLKNVEARQQPIEQPAREMAAA